MCIPVDSTFLFKLIVKRNRCLDKVIFSLEAFFFFKSQQCGLEIR